MHLTNVLRLLAGEPRSCTRGGRPSTSASSRGALSQAGRGTKAGRGSVRGLAGQRAMVLASSCTASNGRPLHAPCRASPTTANHGGGRDASRVGRVHTHRGGRPWRLAGWSGSCAVGTIVAPAWAGACAPLRPLRGRLHRRVSCLKRERLSGSVLQAGSSIGM